MKYRLARWLLGYRPYHLPDHDGVYIVIVDGPATVTMSTKTFDMEQTTTPARFDPKADWDATPPFIGYIPGQRSGAFHGTL